MYLGASLGAEELGQGSTQLGRLSCPQLSQECILSLTPAFKLHPEKQVCFPLDTAAAPGTHPCPGGLAKSPLQK